MTVGESNTEINAITPFWVGQYSTPIVGQFSMPIYSQTHNDVFIDCVATMAQYIYDQFGRFPATVPSIFALMYLQAHQLDTKFYDEHFAPGAYLPTHAKHDSNWGVA